MAKVSVIVPLYNQAKFVTQTLDSIMAQTYEDFEVIVVNDASTDDSLSVVTEYAKNFQKIKIVNNPVNRGLPATRNIAISHSVGDFILPLDSDDRIDPDFLQKTTARMVDGVAIVGTWMHIEPDDITRRNSHEVQQAGAFGSCYPIYAPTREQILTGNSLAICSLIRREALDQAGQYPEDFKNGSEDWCLWCSIICSGRWRVVVVPEYLFHYRVHPDSMCRSSTMAPFPVTRARIRTKFGWTVEEAAREQERLNPKPIPPPPQPPPGIYRVSDRERFRAQLKAYKEKYNVQ